jgi:hypothetical protein
VFASFFSLNVDPGQLLLDAFFVLLGFLVMAGLFRLAASEPLDRVDGPAWRLGATEALVVLVVLDAVFASFALAQVLAAAGAANDSLRSAGVTYSEYARSGFFQLLWVSGITLVVLVVFSRISGLSERSSKVTFTLLAEIAIALTLMVVVVAFNRLSLYEEAYGFTMLRLYSHIFAVVVMLNVDHARSSHKIDAGYFAELSSDATPALLTSRESLDPALRLQLDKVVCAGPSQYSVSLAAFNWADAQAAAARRANCR